MQLSINRRICWFTAFILWLIFRTHSLKKTLLMQAFFWDLQMTGSKSIVLPLKHRGLAYFLITNRGNFSVPSWLQATMTVTRSLLCFLQLLALKVKGLYRCSSPEKTVLFGIRLIFRIIAMANVWEAFTPCLHFIWIDSLFLPADNLVCYALCSLNLSRSLLLALKFA